MKTPKNPEAVKSSAGSDALTAVVEIVWQFLTGHPFGTVQTDATFWHAGTQVVEDGRGRFRVSRFPMGWALAPHRTRLVVRWTAVALVALWVMSPAWMALPMTVICGVLIGALFGMVVRSIRTAAHRRRVVEPLTRALWTALGDRPALVTVPTNYRLPGARTVVTLGEGAVRNEGTMKIVRQALADYLGISSSDLVVSWTVTEDGVPQIVVSRRALIPTAASPRMAGVQDVMMRCAEGTVVLGLARGGRPVTADLDSDSPHAMIGAGSGGGKSVTVGGMCAQLIRQGAAVTILDTKVSSHPWAHDLAGQIPYYTSTADIHDALVRLGDEMQRRNDQLAGLGSSAVAEVVESFRRQVIVVEEVNTLSGRLKKHWGEVREKTDPKESPALAAFVEIANMGRSVKCHLILCGQRLSTQGIGGTAEAGAQIRASCGVRIVARFDDAMWRMVMDGKHRPAPGRPGRCIVQISGARREVQALFWADDDAAVWARGGVPGGDVPDVPDEWQPVDDLRKLDIDYMPPISVTDTQPLQIAARRLADPVTDPDAQKMLEEIETFVRKSAEADLSTGVGTDDADACMGRDFGDFEQGDIADRDASSFVQMSMRQWCESRHFGATVARGVDVLKSARKRDPRFPASVGTDGATNAALFDVEELDEWAKSRVSGTRLKEAS